MIIHATITSSIDMVITGVSRGTGQLQIPPRQEKDPLKRDCSHPKNSPACSLRSRRFWIFFLRTVRLHSTWLEVFTQKQHFSFKMAQVPPCLGFRRSISCLIWSITPTKLCWLVRASLRNLNPRNLILGLFIRMALVLNRDLRSPRGSPVYWVSSSGFFHGLTRSVLVPWLL